MFKKIIKIWYVTTLLFCTMNLYADDAGVYPHDIPDFFAFINTSDDIFEVTKRIETYEKKYKDNLYVYSEIILMKYRVLEQTSSRDTLQSLSKLDAQWQKVAESRDLVSSEYTTWANIKTKKIPYLPLRKVIRESKSSTKSYKMAVKLDKKNALAWMSFGISMLFTPKLVGGGVKKALKYLERAKALITNDLEKYFIHLWLSQAYLKSDNKEKYEQAFKIAQETLGETPALQKAKKSNEKGELLSW